MNNNNNEVDELTHHLKQEISWIKELNQALLEEKNILATRQFDKLEDLANKKQELSTKLEGSSKVRMKLIGDPDTQSPSSFLQQFLQHCSQESKNLINKLNKELSTELTRCRELNTVNGQVIATNIHSRQEIVNILSGNKAKDVNLYTATGDIKTAPNDKGGHHQKA